MGSIGSDWSGGVGGLIMTEKKTQSSTAKPRPTRDFFKHLASLRAEDCETPTNEQLDLFLAETRLRHIVTEANAIVRQQQNAHQD
jgi:hypothetical protein